MLLIDNWIYGDLYFGNIMVWFYKFMIIDYLFFFLYVFGKNFIFLIDVLVVFYDNFVYIFVVVFRDREKWLNKFDELY